MRKILILFAILIATTAFGQKTSKSKTLVDSFIANLTVPQSSPAFIRRLLKANKKKIALRKDPCNCAKDETIPADSVFWQVSNEICEHRVSLRKITDTSEITFYSFEETGKYNLWEISLEEALIRAMVIIENNRLIPRKNARGYSQWIALGKLEGKPVVLFYGDSCGEEKWNLLLGAKISMTNTDWYVFD